jgi:hypothetical protein
MPKFHIIHNIWGLVNHKEESLVFGVLKKIYNLYRFSK